MTVLREHDGTVSPGYWRGVQSLAITALTQWIWSDEEIEDERHWPRWRLFCDIADVDPVAWAEYAKAARTRPHFPCGHTKSTETTVRMRGGKESCRTCLVENGRRGARVRWR